MRNFLIFLGIIAVAFYGMCIGFFIYYIIKGLRPIPCELRKFKEKFILWRLFVELPRRLVLDRLTQDPNVFRPFGLWLICGKQGCGKTMLLTYLLRKYRHIYPRLKVKTNYNYIYEDGVVGHWQDLIDSNNGIYGEIDVIDEIHSWFSSLQSKDFPPDMLSEVSQQRKQRKLIIGTAQVFTRCAKPIREQTYLIMQPTTLFGCLTFVRELIPVLDDSGNVLKYKFKRIFFFVHDDELRNSYDTYKRIQTLAASGFKPQSEQLSNYNNELALALNLDIVEGKKKKAK